ncbi:zinc finger CCHC domain-containing protein 14-like [Ptychodera flava]|uniref:zinc finger CCHC domain-containing protein 14-like n=1 Tax=Ptychodera flava TaxID=63121 RepID=UPI003969E6B8
MVYKEEVYNWFHGLSGSGRVDFLCGLLLKCLPFELRYLGAYIEELARKEYHNLREDENNANKTAFLSQLNDVFDACTRRKLIVSLALLYSTNCSCSDIVFRTLHCQAVQVESNFANIRSNSMDQVYEEFLLLLTMAVHHPAFAFHQKQTLKVILDKLHLLKQSCFKAAYSDSIQDDDEGDSLSESHHKDSNHRHSNVTSDVPNKDNTPRQSSLPSDVHHKDVYVKNIDVTGIQKGADKRSKFVFKVTWSNDVVNTVHKTLGELHVFQCKLFNQFPDSGPHQSDFNLPNLPGKHSSKMTQKGDLAEKGLQEVQDYARQLVALPQRILQCEEILSFFQYPESSSMSTVSSGIQTASTTITVVSSKPPDVVTASHASKLSVHKVPTNTTTNRPMYTQGMPDQSLAVSPLPSPLLSPHISPSPTHGPVLYRSPGNVPSGYVSQHLPQPHHNPVLELLKELRLHKYAAHFKDLTFSQIANLTEDDLDKWEDLTAGAKAKLVKHLNGIRQAARSLNGINDQVFGQSSPFATPPYTRSYSGGNYSMSPHQAPIQNLFIGSHAGQSSHTSEYSSSDCSSSPSSPRDSSDENEKDSEASESSTVSLPETKLSRSTVTKDRTGQIYPSSPVTSYGRSLSTSSVPDLPMRNLHIAVSSTSRKNQQSPMPTYSNVVKSRSMEPISGIENKQQPLGIPHSHSHSMPSSPASETSLSRLQQHVLPQSASSQLMSGHDNRPQNLPGTPSGDNYPTDVNATSPLRSSAMVFTPKQSLYQVTMAHSDVPRSHQIKSPGPIHSTASVEQNIVTTYKTCVAYVPTMSANATSTIGSSIPALTPATAAPLPDGAPSSSVHSTQTVCQVHTTSVKVETIYTSAKTLPGSAQTKVTYSTASPRGGSDSPGANNLHPQSPFFIPNAAQNMNATLPPSNTFNSEHPVTFSSNVPPNYGSGANQGSNYHGNHPANFPNSGNNFSGRGHTMNYNNSGNTENMCTSSTSNNMLCTSCGSPCTNNSFPLHVNPGFVGGPMGSALPYGNFPNFHPANVNGFINPGIPRYHPRVPPHSPFQNGLGGEFLYASSGNFGMIPQGNAAFIHGMFPYGNFTQHAMGHKKPIMPSCYNCGGHGHRAQECKEATMEAFQSKFSLKYTPVTESETDGQ